MKFMSVEELSDWSERHSPAEVQAMVIEQQAQLRSELLASAGVAGPKERLDWTSDDEYSALGPEGREQMEIRGGEAWFDEQAAKEEAEAEKQRQREATEAKARYAHGLAVQRAFCARHSEFIPSEEAGNRLREIFEEANPGATEWTDVGLEAAYSDFLVENLEQ